MRTILALLAASCWVAASGAGEGPPILNATRPVVSIREGDTLRQDAWRLAPAVNPDVYEVELKEGKSVTVTFITDIDSISFNVAEGREYDFIIQHGKDRCATRIAGIRAVPAAVFDAEYQATHQGRIVVETPEVYELVNVAIAMTPTGLADRRLVYHDSDYYASALKWFGPFRDHRAIAAIQAVLKESPYLYSNIKMDGYSFEFDSAGRIVQSRIYNRTAFPSARSNSLRSTIPALQSFADTSKFRMFYKSHQSTYAEQAAFYEDTADVGGMRAWLDRNFPGSARYNSIKIIFSPLVAYSQSATWLESNGFRELQAHVNYPYQQDVSRRTKGARLSKRTETILRGEIVFTELNHGYINLEADKYADRVMRAIGRRDLWVNPERGPSYYDGISAFNEYLNWGLVSLRVADVVPGEEQQTLITMVEEMMTTGRGFPQFAAFDVFLVDLYRHRKEGETISDLYPRIIEWFEKRSAAVPNQGTSQK